MTQEANNIKNPIKSQNYGLGRKIIKFKNMHFNKRDSILKLAIIYSILIIMSIVTLYPMLNVLSISLRPNDVLFSTSIKIIPEGATLDNYRHALFESPLGTWLKNSFIISILTAIIGVVVAASAGYSFSRFKFYGRKTGMMMFLVTQMFPAPMLLLPTYIILVRLGLLNKFLGLLIPYTATAIPFAVWLMKGYFDTIPKALEESAYIDGCSPFKTFYRIIIPLAKPALAISFLNCFMTAWSEFVIARIILSNSDKLTLPVGLVSEFQGQFNTMWGIYSASALLTCIPVMILFMALSRYLVGGLTLGSVKG